MSPHSVRSSNKSGATVGESAKKAEDNFHTPKLSAQDKLELKRVRASDSQNSNSDAKQHNDLQGSPQRNNNNSASKFLNSLNNFQKLQAKFSSGEED